jgi:2-keto-3-deoxy-6-phosphogluconate aldolase
VSKVVLEQPRALSSLASGTVVAVTEGDANGEAVRDAEAVLAAGISLTAGTFPQARQSISTTTARAFSSPRIFGSFLGGFKLVFPLN